MTTFETKAKSWPFISWFISTFLFLSNFFGVKGMCCEEESLRNAYHHVAYWFQLLGRAVMNLSHLWVEQKRSEVTARLMHIKHVAGVLSRCRLFCAWKHALSAGGCCLRWKHKLKSFVNQPLEWKLLHQLFSRRHLLRTNEGKKLFAINTEERPKPSADFQCSAWSTSDHYCVIGVGGLQGCPDSSCQREKGCARELHLFRIVKGSLALAGGGVPNG